MTLPTIDRRRFALWAAGALLPAARAFAQPGRPWLGDMHSHRGMFRAQPAELKRELEESGTTLVGWALVDDTPLTRNTGSGIEQVRDPNFGELWAYFQRRVARYDAELKAYGLAKALTPADVDAALQGKPHVVMASEAASFLEGRPERVREAHAMGLRHLQLVHFIESPLGDFQTKPPRHEGLTPTGAQVIRECRRAGVLVDLAHCSAAMVDAALDASDGPMVWSHSWVRAVQPSWRDWPYIARAMSLAQARRFAARGGVIGLWSARVKSDRDYKVRDAATYADEIMRMVDLLGPRAVAFGTDMDGAGRDPVLSDYRQLREVAEHLVRRGLPEAVLHDVCIGNYARVVKAAMAGAART